MPMLTVGNSQKSGIRRGMGIRAEAAARDDLAPEMVELVLGQATLQKRSRVHPRRGVALVEDLVAGTFVLAPEEMVEAHLVKAGRAGIRGEVAADPREGVVGAQHHGGRVPADQATDPALDCLVAREGGLLLGADRVDIPGLGEGRAGPRPAAGPA